MKDPFRKIASRISIAVGGANAFLAAFLVVIIWAFLGPAFNFSNTWQLFINTGTTITTFLMVFLIQNTQNRESRAMQLKLDELLRSGSGRDSFIDIEDISDEELYWMNEEFKKLHEHGTQHPAMHKLHQKIRTAHEMRQSKHSSPVNTTEHVIETLNPFSHSGGKGK